MSTNLNPPPGRVAPIQTDNHSDNDNQADFRNDMQVLGDEGGEGDNDNVDNKPPVKPAPKEDEHVEDEDEGEEPSEELEHEGESEPDVEEETTLEETTSVEHPRPTYRDIKAAYPDFFKKFPDLKHMIFREEQYTQLFPTVEEAKDASERANDYSNFQKLLDSGDPKDFGEFLNGIKEGGDDMLTNMAANFLPSLYNTNKDMYFSVTTPIVESMLRGAFKAAGQTNDDNLKNAALHIARWALGDVAYATGDKQSPPLKTVKGSEDKKDPKYEQEKAAFYTQRYDEARSYVSGTSQKRLTAEILKGLDPNGVMKQFTRQAAVRQIIEGVGEAMEKDPRHMKVMNSLWEQGNKAGFTGNWKDRLLTTYLSRARALMPAIRTKVREAAMADEENHQQVRGERADKSRDRRDVSGSNNAPGNRTPRPPSASEIDWSKTSDLDLLSDNVKLKK